MQLRHVLPILLLASPAAAGTWTKLGRNPPGAANLMILLSNGSVMVTDVVGNPNGTWMKLTPAPNGSYASGSWSSLPKSKYTRLYFSSQVLTDGRVFIAGGEYGDGGSKAEIFDPTLNTWSDVSPPTTLLDPSQASPVTGLPQAFLDSNSAILPDGRVLVAPVSPMFSGYPLIYNPTTNTWAKGPKYRRLGYQDEATWLKLPDDTILTIDPGTTFSERFSPAHNLWLNDGVVPATMYNGGELGPAALLASGRVFWLGATGHTVLYTPSGTIAAGVWQAGPDIPSGYVSADAPSCMMVTGNILCTVGPASAYTSAYFFEYDPIANTFIPQPAPDNSTPGTPDGVSPFQTNMLALPDGSVLYSHMSSSVYTYTPSGTPLAAGKPTITHISKNADGSYLLVGTGLNGISEGACYGDDFQMATNFPLVRISYASGRVYYARTFNWSSTSVMTGSRPVSTEFTLPSQLPPGPFSLCVVANGFASDPLPAPTIASQPESVQSCSGGSASFTVHATGVGDFSYQWRRGTTPLTDSPPFSGTTTPTLSISPASAADAATNYNCLVSTIAASTASNPASLTICSADFNCDGFVDVYDFSDFVTCFEGGACPQGKSADFNRDGFADIFDFSDFVTAFEPGC